MKRLLTGICAAAMTVSLGAAIPATAAPFSGSSALQAAQTQGTDIHLAQWGERHPRHWRGWRDGRHWRGGHWDRDHRYWRGHRGYRYARPGYRYHDGFWFPPAAFIAGAIIGGAIASAPPASSGGTYHYSPEHVEWCSARYRSYRAWDNSFQPYHGPRRGCASPYM